MCFYAHAFWNGVEETSWPSAAKKGRETWRSAGQKRWPEALETKIPEEGETGGKGNGVVSPTQKSRRGRNHFPFRLYVKREPNSSSSHKEMHFLAGSRRRQAVRILGKVKEVKRMMGRGTEREIKEVV